MGEGRYRAAPIDSEAYFLACCRTIELNPVRARMVRHPRDHAWSSDNAHARRAMDPLPSGHALFDGLGGWYGRPSEGVPEAVSHGARCGLLPLTERGNTAESGRRFKLKNALFILAYGNELHHQMAIPFVILFG
jgi:hypothetical protein